MPGSEMHAHARWLGRSPEAAGFHESPSSAPWDTSEAIVILPDVNSQLSDDVSPTPTRRNVVCACLACRRDVRLTGAFTSSSLWL